MRALLRVVQSVVLLMALFCASTARGVPNSSVVLMPPGMQSYPSPYYIVYSDIELPRVKEAVLRMTRMAEEYHDRTKEFAGQIRTKFSFYLFKNKEDYFNAGGLPGSAGVYMRSDGEPRLMGIAGENENGFTWHLIQHEGFHQFADAVIGGGLPTWLNEGLAEYFGEGIFTGDGMVTGVIPPDRCKRIQAEIRDKRFRTVQSMMLMNQAQWNADIAHTNYDMAWSMTHFLAHGEGGKYQPAFAQFIRDIGNHRPWDKAWVANFGPADGFEKKWSEWWLAQDPDVTKDLFVKATVASMTSFIGRAQSQKQTFDTVDEFTQAARVRTLKIPDDDWLPPTLISSMLDLKDKLGDEITYELGKDSKTPQVIATMPDKTRLVASYNRAIKSGPGRVTVAVDDLAPKMEKAKALAAEKKKPEAKALLLDAIKRNPTSPRIPEARKLLQTM